MSALDELLESWRRNPDAGTTIALCSYLGASRLEDLIREVGHNAQSWHQRDPDVMLAVGRMYLDANMLQEAQSALVSAGKAATGDGRPFRYLGEVLLRRGDAARGEKVLARAIELGQGDSDTRIWYDRAVVYAAMQQRSGATAVASEIARSLPAGASAASPAFAPQEPPTLVQGTRPPPVPPHRAPPPPAAQNVGQLSPPTAVGGFEPPVNLPYGRGGAPEAEPIPDAGSFESIPTILHNPRAEYAEPLAADRVVTQPQPIQADFDDQPRPEPSLVLEHLARVGVYEPGGGAPPAWEAALPQKARGLWFLVVATVLVVVVGSGAWLFARHVKQQRLARARHLETEAELLIQRGAPADLRSSDAKLAEVFELDSLSPHAARLWLRNRVLSEIWAPGETRGIDSAVYRAKTVGLGEHELASGRIASYLSEGDLAGAVAILPRWDEKAAKDAYYQLAAGATLERAGDPRAIERYEAARSLDPKLVVAEVMLARLALVELGVQARPIVQALKPKLGDKPVMRSLSALAWAVDPDRPRELPDDAHLEDEHRAALPTPLRPIPQLVEALQAIDSDEPTRAARGIDRGIQLSTTPAMATRFGFLAIQADNEKLAQKAALQALKLAAVYPQARVLAARVALLGGRFDEAKKAIEELDPASPDVAVVRCIVAYETLDLSELERAVDALGKEAKKRPAFAALVSARGVLLGTRYPEPVSMTSMAAPQVAWGEPVALDAALDTGRIDLADAMANRFTETDRPAYLLRLSRLRRYQGKHELSLKASESALLAAPTAATLIERVFSLVAGGRPDAASDVVANHPALMGPTTEFVRAFVDAKNKRVADAKVKAAELELPPSEAPLLLRVLAARALAVSNDKRARPYIKDLAKDHARHPDVVLAASGK